MCEQMRVLGVSSLFYTKILYTNYDVFLQCSRALVKKSLKMIPVLGWTAFFAGNVFLERDWEKDKVLMGDQLTALSENPDPVLVSKIS